MFLFIVGVDLMLSYLTNVEEFVKEMYIKINIKESHQLNFRSIAKRLNIVVYYWNETSQALFFHNKGYILLDGKLSAEQQWQDFCHELGHVLLHTGNQQRMYPLFREYQEYKANNFMYHACVPSFMLDELEPSDLTVENVQRLFNVEYDFAFKRLEQYRSKKLLMLNWNRQNDNSIL